MTLDEAEAEARNRTPVCEAWDRGYDAARRDLERVDRWATVGWLAGVAIAAAVGFFVGLGWSA